MRRLKKKLINILSFICFYILRVTFLSKQAGELLIEFFTLTNEFNHPPFFIKKIPLFPFYALLHKSYYPKKPTFYISTSNKFFIINFNQKLKAGKFLQFLQVPLIILDKANILGSLLISHNYQIKETTTKIDIIYTSPHAFSTCRVGKTGYQDFFKLFKGKLIYLTINNYIYGRVILVPCKYVFDTRSLTIKELPDTVYVHLPIYGATKRLKNILKEYIKRKYKAVSYDKKKFLTEYPKDLFGDEAPFYLDGFFSVLIDKNEKAYLISSVLPGNLFTKLNQKGYKYYSIYHYNIK